MQTMSTSKGQVYTSSSLNTILGRIKLRRICKRQKTFLIFLKNKNVFSSEENHDVLVI